MLSPRTLLLLLAASVNRREVIAFVQTTALLTQQPLSSSASQSPTLLRDRSNNLDVATAPLNELIRLECDDNNNEKRNKNCYELVSPVDDVLELKEGQRLVCIGDVHGDLEALEEFLYLAEVYNPKTDEWTGEDTILVQCGDVLDRGSEELDCFHLLTKLSRQAAAQGGHVILLWGNHEALNAGGMFHYTTGEAEYENKLGKTIDAQLQTEKWRMQYAGNQPARWAAYEPGSGVLANPLLANMKVAVKVGRTVCVHAGLTSKHLDLYGGIKGMNQDARDWMIGKAAVPNNNLGRYDSIGELVYEVQKRAESGADRMPEVLGGGSGENSPVWMRDFSSPNDAPPSNPKAQQLIDAALFHLQADRMVMGHTVQRQINAALNGKAWRVDVGASKGVMNGTPEVLEVIVQGGKEVVSVLTRKGVVKGKDRLVGARSSVDSAAKVLMG